MERRAPWPVRWLAEILVLVLLAFGVAAARFDLGDRWFGWGPDPKTEPAAVAPPEGLRLPQEAAAGPVSTPPAVRPADPARVAAAIRPMLPRRGVLGRHVGVLVTDLASGRALFRSGASTITPASTTKLLTSTAALESLGPMARFRTTVRWDAAHRRLVLVGGGDPFLASSPRAGAGPRYPHKADVATLAQAAARRLRAMHVRRVSLAYDDSSFSGPAVNPTWPATYLPESVVSPISALWVDEGHAPGGEGFVADPAAEAARVFGDALRARRRARSAAEGRPGQRPDRAPSRSRRSPAPRSARSSSAPSRSATTRPPRCSPATSVSPRSRRARSRPAPQSVLEVLHRLGVDVSGDKLYDGSGLSRLDRLTTDTLDHVVRLATSREHPELRSVMTGLPVAGFTGSLTYRFDKGPVEAKGRVRAKTGTLTGVHALAGLADDATGARMVFVVVADRVRLLKNLEAQTLIDRIAGALGACRCGVGSTP